MRCHLIHGALLFVCGTAHAAEPIPNYPSEPIHYIVPFAQADASGLVSGRPARGQDAQGIDLASSTPEAFGALIKTEVPRWSKIIRDAGARVD